MWYNYFIKQSNILERGLGKGWITPENEVIDIDMYHDDWSDLHGHRYIGNNNRGRSGMLEQGWCRIYPSRYSINFTFPVNYIDNILHRVIDYIYQNLDKIHVPIEIELTDRSGVHQYSLCLFPLEFFLSLDLDEIKRRLKC